MGGDERLVLLPNDFDKEGNSDHEVVGSPVRTGLDRPLVLVLQSRLAHSNRRNHFRGLHGTNVRLHVGQPSAALRQPEGCLNVHFRESDLKLKK